MSTQRNDPRASRRIIDALRLTAFGYANIVIPQIGGLDWERMAADPSVPLVVTNRPSIAVKLCEQGQPAIAIMGASKSAIVKWLRDRGSNVIDKSRAH
jgi:hypothetical protein